MTETTGNDTPIRKTHPVPSPAWVTNRAINACSYCNEGAKEARAAWTIQATPGPRTDRPIRAAVEEDMQRRVANHTGGSGALTSRAFLTESDAGRAGARSVTALRRLGIMEP